MPGWFDIDHLDEASLQAMMRGHKGFDPPGVDESIHYVKDLISKEVAAGIPAHRIVLGGFSQGGHIALKTALMHSPALAGCVALSTWLEPSLFEASPGRSSLGTAIVSPMIFTNIAFCFEHSQIPDDNLDLPIFFGHGSADPLIPGSIANATVEGLRKGRSCRDIDFKLYPGMGHSSCPQELADLKRFLAKVLPEKVITGADVEAMSVRELKAFLQARGISVAGILEKEELVVKALNSL